MITIRFSGSLFLSTIENYIPASIPRLKMVIGGLKYIVALPIKLVDYLGNKILKFGEKFFMWNSLLITIINVYRINEGPYLSKMGEFKKPIINGLIERL